MRLKNIRSRKGASMIVLVTCIAFFIVLPLSLIGFEMGRYFLLVTQVENVAGACALSGTGAIATIPSTASSGPTLQNLYNGCAQEAVYCLQLNSILGTPMVNALGPPPGNISNNTLAPYTAPPTPPVGQGAIAMSFLNQDGSWHQDLTTSGAVKMSVTISFTTKPVFSVPGMLMNLMPTETATASSTGGLPQLDVFLCFDLSGSMDDQTGVAYVNRYWDVQHNCVNYGFSANQNGGTPNTIYNQTPGVGITGTQLNAIPPQNLAKCSNQNNIFFNEQVRCGAATEAGQLPGGVTMVGTTPTPGPITYPGYGTQNPYTVGTTPNVNWYNPGGASFTDMVVIPSAGAAGAAYVVPAGWQTTAVVECEQSRGNLASAALLNASQGGATYLNNNPYKAALNAAIGQTAQQYWAYAAQKASPSFDALTAGQNFVSTMNLSTDARFGLSTFADSASSPSLNTIAGPNYLISGAFASYAAYTPGGQPAGGTYPLPWVSLSAGSPGSFNQAFAALAPPTSSYNPSTTTTQAVPTGATNIWDALNNAINDVTSNGRSTARKAIVLFTDGIPTPPPGPSGTIPAGNTNSGLFSLAGTCNTPNIPIYTIGLAQGADPALVSAEGTLLQGISNAGGAGGTYFPTTSSSQLNSAFQSIARSLVLLRAGG
ncbi:MAG TPA: vWA domain-containing protein [Drouetiella sp.]|jgi:von Willebrand factor type A domain